MKIKKILNDYLIKVFLRILIFHIMEFRFNKNHLFYQNRQKTNQEYEKKIQN